MQVQPNPHNPAALLQGLLQLWFKYNDVWRCTIEEKMKKQKMKSEMKQFLVIKVLRHTVS